MLRRSLVTLWIVLAFLAILGVGFWGGRMNARQRDAERRAILLEEAQHLAQAIDPDLVRLLTFTPADAGSPAFERLSTFFAAYARIRPLYRGIYTMALRGEHLVFGPESYPPDDPMASPPGTVYLEPSEVDFRVLREGVGYVGGPASDEYGTFVFALAPVRDPLTGQVLMAVGIDVLAEDWQAEMRKAYRVPLVFAGLADLILIASVWAFRHRARAAQSGRRCWHYLEVGVTLAYGALFAAFAAWIAGKAGAMERAHLFEMLTDARAAVARTALTRVETNLKMLQRFFASSEDVHLEEFANFVSPLAQGVAVDSYLWIPEVPAEKLGIFFQAARKEGLTDFSLWELDAAGAPRAVSERARYYPVFYVEPLETEALEGLDLGSMPQCLVAVEKAAQTGLATLAELILPGQGESKEPLWYAFLPARMLKADSSSGEPHQGFVAVAFRPQYFWETVLWAEDRGSPVLAATLMDLESGHPMAYFPAGADEGVFSLEELELKDRYVHVIPLLVFDRPMLLVFRPLPAFFALRPARAALASALGVIAVTSLLAIFVGFLRQRQEALERLVEERTAALRESQQRLQALFDNALDAFILADEGGRLVEVNPATCRLFNLSREDLLGRSWLDVADERDREFAQTLWRRLLEQGTLEGEYDVVGEMVIEFRAVANISPGLHLVALRDVTERKRAEANRREMERLLFEAQRLESLGILAGGIAHDFNNLLAVILGNIELATLDLPPEASARAALEEALRASHRAADLTRQMLAYSGKGHFVLAPVDLNTLIRENAEMLRVAVPHHVTLSLDLASNLPHVEVDRGQLQQVIMNLIINAAEAIGEKPGVVTLATGVADYDAETLAHSRTVEKPAPGRYVWMSVTDTGIGMSPETLERIFEPFFTTKATGRGLGMAAVLGIVRGHKGAIWVESAPGHGTTVRVAFPAVEEAPQSVVSQGPAQETLASHGTILVVDDEEMVRRLTCRALERAGWQTLCASSGEEACALYTTRQAEIEAVVLDLTMPGMNGLATLEALRKINPEVRVLLCSGYGEDVISRQVADKSHLAFLQKPFNREDLLATLAQVLRS